MRDQGQSAPLRWPSRWQCGHRKRLWARQSLLHPLLSAGHQVNADALVTMMRLVPASTATSVLAGGTKRLLAGVQAHVSSFKHKLPNGLQLEVLHQAASVPEPGGDSLQPRAPLLFLHGAGHAAWCWQVRMH